MAEDIERPPWIDLPLIELQNIYDSEKFEEETMSGSEFLLLRNEILKKQIDILKNNSEQTTESATLEMMVTIQTMQDEYSDLGYACEAVWSWRSKRGQLESDNSMLLNTIISTGTTVEQIRDLLPLGIKAPVFLGQDATQRTQSVLTVKIENSDDPEDRTKYSIGLFPKDSSLVMEVSQSENSRSTIKKEWEELVAPIDYNIVIHEN